MGEPLDAAVGKALFDKLWVAAPSSTHSSDGLGPLFNARSCATCHAGHGEGIVPRDASLPAQSSLVLRLGGEAGDPRLGLQLQTAAIGGFEAEGAITQRLVISPANPAGGAGARLSRPVFTLHLSDAAIDPAGLAISARRTPALTGVALIDRIDDAAILAGADPDDRDGDGISGIARAVDGGVGRFGWKAGEPHLADQIASAFSIDIGLSTPLRPEASGDCTALQTACRAAPAGAAPGETEVTDTMIAMLSAYLQTFRPRAASGDAGAGARLFGEIGCAACHWPRWTIAGDAGDFEIAPYSDFLLHDLGAGLGDDAATGPLAREWRTAPLWRTKGAGARSGLLHDGRALSLDEAILWHGGEADRARTRYRALSEDDRQAVLIFLETL